MRLGLAPPPITQSSMNGCVQTGLKAYANDMASSHHQVSQASYLLAEAKALRSQTESQKTESIARIAALVSEIGHVSGDLDLPEHSSEGRHERCLEGADPRRR